jgi:hypothetical protein
VTVERGQDWGRQAPLPPHGVIVSDDAEARSLVTQARRAGRPPPPLGLLGGDLHRTLGGRRRDEAHLRSSAATTLDCDLGSILVDGHQHWFVAHAILRRSWWHGRVIAIMNAQWHRRWDVAPRAHPGDGLIDVIDGDLRIADRWRARDRLPTGTHLPHPRIRSSRVPATTIELDPALDVWLDGERISRARSVAVRIEPDALTIVI